MYVHTYVNWSPSLHHRLSTFLPCPLPVPTHPLLLFRYTRHGLLPTSFPLPSAYSSPPHSIASLGKMVNWYALPSVGD